MANISQIQRYITHELKTEYYDKEKFYQLRGLEKCPFIVKYSMLIHFLEQEYCITNKHFEFISLSAFYIYTKKRV